MRYIADLHLHSKYSRATSKDMVLEVLDKWGKMKGIDILGTGDFTHPLWLREIKEKLEPLGNGLFKLKDEFILDKERDKQLFFILSTEISCIYSKNGKVRRIHILFYLPTIEAVEKVNSALAKIGNLQSDGRPILGLDAQELVKVVLEVSEDALIIPAHIWTPWFSLFGSNSGFDSVEECFGETTEYIYAMETGLSSDPPMNWRLSTLDRFVLVSNSDAHSPENLGREANVFNTDNLSFEELKKILKEKDKKKFLYTIEFFPQEGKYHYDGHRKCGLSFSPEETKKLKGICPKCHRPLTKGVLYRVDSLADREEGFIPSSAIPFKHLIPLKEIIAEIIGQGKKTKKVEYLYQEIIRKGESEFKVLLDLPFDELKKITLPEIAQGVIDMREGKVKVIPGYDGLYGKILFEKEKTKKEQNKLF